MDDLLAAAGAENVEYPLKTACCGGAHTLSDSDTSTKLVLNLLTTAEACGADVIATECPTCHTGLEMHQVRAEKVLGRKTSVKILYFTQLLGMALGLSARRVGVHENFSELIRFAACAEGWADDRHAQSNRLDDIAARLDAIVASPDAALVGSARRSPMNSWRWRMRFSKFGFRHTTRRRRRARPRAFAYSLCSARVLAVMQVSTPAARPVANSSITAISSGSIPITRTPYAGFVLAPWWQDIWRSLSAASLKWRASANFAAHRGHCVSTKQTCSRPKLRDLEGELDADCPWLPTSRRTALRCRE